MTSHALRKELQILIGPHVWPLGTFPLSQATLPHASSSSCRTGGLLLSQTQQVIFYLSLCKCCYFPEIHILLAPPTQPY